MEWNAIASQERIDKVIKALTGNGITAHVVETGEQARQKVLDMIPAGAEVMTMTSTTNDTIGLAQEINESEKYNATRSKLMDKGTSPREKKRLGGGPEWTVGSVHAVTENGEAMIASNTGSQLGAYAYGADHVIWVVGAQKIVADKEAGLKRIYEHVLPLESARANKAYNITTGSNVSKMLIVNKEITPDRITMIIVKEVLGF